MAISVIAQRSFGLSSDTVSEGLVSVCFPHGPRMTSLDIGDGIVFKFMVGSIMVRPLLPATSDSCWAVFLPL